MTVEELLAREAIRKTMAAYTVNGDRLIADAVVACFTPDGVLETDAVPPPDDFCYAGQAAIHAWLTRWQAQPATHAARFVRHQLTTCDIDLTSSVTARARTYWTAWTDIGPDHSGFYLDDFAKVGEDWLISRRRVRLDWQAEHSLFYGAVTNSAESNQQPDSS